MRLSDLLQTIQPVRITGNTSMEITGVNIDSRLIGTGHLFMAMRGTQTDGHAYIPAAIDKGAVAVLCEELPEELKAGITYIQVKDSEDAVGKVATTFYGDPTSKMELIGVTGTNGKTTVATLSDVCSSDLTRSDWFPLYAITSTTCPYRPNTPPRTR